MFPVFVDLWRYFHGLVMAVVKPAQSAGNAAQSAMAVLTTLGIPLAVTVLAEQTKGTIERWTGLYQSLIPWVALVSTTLFVGGFLVWRSRDKRVAELEARLVPSLDAHIHEVIGSEIRLRLTNKSETEIERCEVRFIEAIRIQDGFRTIGGMTLGEMGTGSHSFSIPPLGLVYLTVLSWIDQQKAMFLIGHRAQLFGNNERHCLEPKETKIQLRVQAANMKPVDILYDLNPAAKQGPFREPS